MSTQSNIFSNKAVEIYTDGGARGNPGPAALGVVINGKGYSQYLGVKTNNEAEYEALIFALEKAQQLLGKPKAKQAEVLVHMDSELVVKQMRGEYKVSEGPLQLLFMKVWNLRIGFKKVEFVHVPRAANAAADKLVNAALDAAAN